MEKNKPRTTTNENGEKVEKKAAKIEDFNDNLITYKEFVNAIRALPDMKILPRTLSFNEVLGTEKFETAYFLSDT